VQPDWVKQSLTPSIAVGDGVQYGFKWWLYPYTKGDTRLAWGGSGLGGQRPIYFPDYDLLVVFTGWNILPGTPSLSPRIAIDRILEASSGAAPPRSVSGSWAIARRALCR
jgi:hypothetical protein